MSSTTHEFDETINRIEERIGVPTGFFSRLIDEDDWSFIIKSHALVEAALTHWIIAHLDQPNLAEFVSRLDTSDSVRGKLAMMNRLELLKKEERKFIIALSELRNRLVHDVSNTTFQLSTYIEKMDKNQRESFCETLGFGWQMYDEETKSKSQDREFVLAYPKGAIRASVQYILVITSINMDIAEQGTFIQSLYTKIAEHTLGEGT